MKHPRFIKRTIKNGVIKFDHRLWSTEGDTSHIEGRKMIFGTYSPEYVLLSLWGTPEFYNADPESNEEWNEVCEIMGIKEDKSFPDMPSGHYHMAEENGEFVSYKSRNIDWWKPIKLARSGASA